MCRRVYCGLLLCAALVIGGCSDDDPIKVVADSGTKIDSSIGAITRATGGKVSTADGKVSVEVPAESVEKDVTITITAQTNYPADARVVKGTVFEFNPAGTTFSKPATLTIAYAVADLPAGAQEDSLAIYKVVGSAWELVENSKVDLTKKSVTTTVSSFSSYGILAGNIVTDAGVDQLKVDTSSLDAAVDNAMADMQVLDVTPLDTTTMDTALVDTALIDTQILDTTIANDLSVDTMTIDSAAPVEGSVAACNTVVNNAQLITRIKTDDSPPTLTGGTVVDGTYYLTEEVYYDSEANDNYVQETLVISNGGTVGEIVLLQAKTNPPPGPEYHVNTSYTFTGGANVTLAYTCGVSGGIATTYQATSTTFTIRLGAADRTYTKQ